MPSSTIPLLRFPGIGWLLWVPLVFLLDQISKWLILHYLTFGEIVPIFPGLKFILAHNHGIAFSFFNQQSGLMPLVLLAVIIMICLVMGIWLIKTPMDDRYSGIGLVLIFGGALGNLFDRFYHGFVIDFIDCYIGHWHWYTFNLADSFVTIGALLMIKTIMFNDKSL
ncbi:MAG: signal peptidase II [Candidatus Berkiellales bacterium]